jgi:hypothetical protein
VRILPGDRVKVEMTPYDLEKGRITYRLHADAPLTGVPGAPSTSPSPAPTPNPHPNL